MTMTLTRNFERSLTSLRHTSIPHLKISARENAKTSLVLSRFSSTLKSKESEHAHTTVLTWPEYLAIRAKRRKWQNAMSVPTSFLGLFGGASYFGNLTTDPMTPVFGLDPFMFYGICTAACMGFGYLLGPSLGNAIWRFTHRHYGDLIDSRDREFYQHITKRRVDASLQSPTSPVPDYYGEKIGSLHHYRRV
ncbi:hypothetical protein E1B28_008371 [Marasmius oreades]|uniref:Presequence translocated-associated motor subunit PAM17 n=1 Tax=Marasmius oreades TaxID=181124 RepID=A0A9P7US21_9AGAR|nr:uncharacterized protein E1B28_008371 [Marasmius oreades]KAG7091983.1 hypothetical protein E1B28_008371 [Marasmius oreades]